LIEKANEGLTAYISYKTHADKNSLYNTPPVFSIYAIKLVMEWVKACGGIDVIEENAEKKSSAIYNAIDKNNAFYRCPVDRDSRSKMNIVFTLPTKELESKFIDQAASEGMIGLKGHKSVGGCRASIYNAMPIDGALALASFMEHFVSKNG
jgi:phosphoserine aminotransferase